MNSDSARRLVDFLAYASEELKKAGIDTPQWDARLLTSYALGLDRAQLFSQSQRLLEDAESSAIHGILTRRMRYESVARIVGHREFWGLEFGLNDSTLEPRPDSEILVEASLDFDKKRARILDLGTGSGCLLLALLHDMPDASGIGIDISPRAIEQATRNARALGLHQRATFQSSNWLKEVTGKFDIIICNPPYIPAATLSELMPEVRDYDPKAALDGGRDGLDPYRHLIPKLGEYLRPEGRTVFEVGAGQAKYVTDLFAKAGFTDISIHNDLAGMERCVTAAFVSPALRPPHIS